MIALGSILAIGGYVLSFFAAKNIAMLTIAVFMSGLAMFPISYLQSLLIMNLSTYNEYKGLPRMESMTGQVGGFTSKVFNGLGTVLQGILLSAGGYITGETLTQPQSAILMIRFCYSLIPGCLFILILFFAWQLTKLEKQIPQMETEILERRQKSSEENQKRDQ